MPPFATLLLSLALPSLASGASGGGQVALAPDRDNTIWEDPAGATSNGAGDSVVAGQNGQALARRALLRFDVAGALPPGAQVASAALTLTVRQTSSGPRTLALHRLLADWGEGASVAAGGSGAPAEPGDATWLHTFHPGAFWTSPGGDFAAQASAAAVVDQLGPYTWSSPALAADVQAMLDSPAANFGWLLLGDETAPQTTKLFGSRESALVGERPLLVIDWVPAPVDYCTAGVSGVGCRAELAASGVASASAGSGFVLLATDVDGLGQGLVYYGTSGRQALPWGSAASFQCVVPPLRRTPLQAAGGTPGTCSGTLSLDLNAHWSAKPQANPGVGAVVQAQTWIEDGGTGVLSNALEFVLAP